MTTSHLEGSVPEHTLHVDSALHGLEFADDVKERKQAECQHLLWSVP